MKRKHLLIILLVTAIAVWYAYTEYNRTSSSLRHTEAAAIVAVPALLATFEKDSARAVQQFADKVIAVTGSVKKIDAESNPVIIFLGNVEQLSSVQCSMDSTDAENYKRLQTGAVATIKGQVSGFRTDALFGTDVILNRCVVVSNP